MYTVYKTTNNINNKIYIGVHRTNNPHDSYLGSGPYLLKAVKFYGKENFTKEILFIFDNKHDAYDKEQSLVDKEFYLREDTYNLGKGGYGRSGNYKPGALARSKKHLEKLEYDPLYKKEFSKSLSEGIKRAWAQGKMTNFSFSGKKHSKETRKLMSNSHKGKHIGSKNSQFGTMWINNGKEVRKIKKEEPIPVGWSRGRKYITHG